MKRKLCNSPYLLCFEQTSNFFFFFIKSETEIEPVQGYNSNQTYNDNSAITLIFVRCTYRFFSVEAWRLGWVYFPWACSEKEDTPPPTNHDSFLLSTDNIAKNIPPTKRHSDLNKIFQSITEFQTYMWLSVAQCVTVVPKFQLKINIINNNRALFGLRGINLVYILVQKNYSSWYCWLTSRQWFSYQICLGRATGAIIHA